MVLLMAVLLSWQGFANPQPVRAQGALFTPTPNPDGRILYYVKEGDSCISIALRYLNGDTARLTQLNNLDQDCNLQLNQELLLGTYQTPVYTPGPSPTPTMGIPSPTPYNGNGIICVLLFLDENGNASLDSGEVSMDGGAINISDREGKVSLNKNSLYDPDNLPVCFDLVPEGSYNISVGLPEGYNSTTSMNYPLELKAGKTVVVDFGAQLSSAALPQQDPNTEGESETHSPVLAIIGGLLVVGGIGLGIYFVFMRRAH